MIIGSMIPREDMKNTMNAIAADYGLTPVSGQTGLLERRACEENCEVLLSAFLDSQDIRQTSRETYYWGKISS